VFNLLLQFALKIIRGKNMKVVKFGGSSLATGNNVDKALKIIKADA
jgi:aspartokinase